MRIFAIMALCLSFFACGDGNTESSSNVPDAVDTFDDSVLLDATEDASSDDTLGDTDTREFDAGTPETPDASFVDGLFVHAERGQDTPDHGTMNAPYASIHYAIDHAEPPTVVHVAAGTYREVVTLRSGVSLLGGYSATDWADRDPESRDVPEYRTSIIAEIGIGVIGGEGVDGDTVLEGFYIEGGIEAHDHHSHGIYLYDGASPVIHKNTIHGGYGDQYSSGITTVSDAAPTIQRNIIIGGAAPTTYALRLSETTALVTDNLVIGRGNTVESYGVLVNNGSPIVVNNTVYVGDTETAYGVFLFTVATPTILNNIIVVEGSETSYCVFEATIGGDAAELRNNDLFGCDTALYHDWGGSPTDIRNLEDLHALTDTLSSGNLSVDPRFVSSSDLHLQPVSPVEVREGGLDAFALGLEVDMDGIPRTVPWSLGAYELD